MPNNYLSVLYKHNNSSGKWKCVWGGGGGGGTNIPLSPTPVYFIAYTVQMDWAQGIQLALS